MPKLKRKGYKASPFAKFLVTGLLVFLIWGAWQIGALQAIGDLMVLPLQPAGPAG